MKVVNSNYRILIVDHQEDDLFFLEKVLKENEFNVIKTHSGKEAIELFRKEQPDLVISEVVIPDMSGFEICDYIKNKSESRITPVIFLTSNDDSQSIIDGFKAGADENITKPFNIDILLARVRHQLSLLIAKRTIIKKNKELYDTVVSRDRLYSVIAHDIRSPLATIKMILNLLAESDRNVIKEDTMHQMLRDANFITEELFSLLDNLLKWTKTQTGNMIPLFQEIDLTEILKGSVDIFRKVGIVKNIKIELNSIPKAKVNIDIEMVKSCIRNLYSNALKFSYNGNKIIVSLKEKQDCFIISVQDFGCGMNAESAQKLLNPNTHFSTFGTAHEQGSGLGLLLVKEMIEKNRGKLWFETEEGKGSTFYISIPKLHHEGGC